MNVHKILLRGQGTIDYVLKVICFLIWFQEYYFFFAFLCKILLFYYCSIGVSSVM